MGSYENYIDKLCLEVQGGAWRYRQVLGVTRRCLKFQGGAWSYREIILIKHCLNFQGAHRYRVPPDVAQLKPYQLNPSIPFVRTPTPSHQKTLHEIDTTNYTSPIAELPARAGKGRPGLNLKAKD